MNRVHLHLTSAGPGDQERHLAAALGLGASHLDVGQRPEEGHKVLADPEGNEFCVIEPGNAYLAGCGPWASSPARAPARSGSSGPRSWTGRWGGTETRRPRSSPPYGGTKVAWAGPPLAPKHGRNRQRFDLLAVDTDLTAEVVRITALGATLLSTAKHGAVELVDPDGNEFRLTTA